MNILFVCTGNTCRSPMAAALLKAMLKKRDMKDFKVASAGISSYPGQTASPLAEEVMNEQGVSLKDHRTQQIHADLLKKSDLILTMTEGHKNSVLSQEPSVWNKIFTLKEYAGMEERDIQDPYGFSKKKYHETMEEIRKALDKVIEKLLMLP